MLKYLKKNKFGLGNGINYNLKNENAQTPMELIIAPNESSLHSQRIFDRVSQNVKRINLFFEICVKSEVAPNKKIFTKMINKCSNKDEEISQKEELLPILKKMFAKFYPNDQI